MEVFLIISGVYLYEIIQRKEGWTGIVLILSGWYSLRLIGSELRWLYAICLTLLILLFLQDKDTMYFSYHWLFGVFVVCALWRNYDPVPLLNRMMGMVVYGIPAVCMHYLKKEWIGSADCIAFLISGWMLGWERIITAFMISVMAAFVWYFILRLKHRTPLIPYISCLSVGIWISLLRGYTIYSFFRGILGI